MERHSAALLFSFIQSTVTTLPTLEIEKLLQYYSTLFWAPEVMYVLRKVDLCNFKIEFCKKRIQLQYGRHNKILFNLRLNEIL